MEWMGVRKGIYGVCQGYEAQYDENVTYYFRALIFNFFHPYFSPTAD